MKFYTWLMHNRWRADPIGDLAREVYTDANWSKEANTWAKVRAAIPYTACREAKQALREAWEEYEGYVGGSSHLAKNRHVIGVVGDDGLEPADEPPDAEEDETWVD